MLTTKETMEVTRALMLIGVIDATTWIKGHTEAECREMIGYLPKDFKFTGELHDELTRRGYLSYHWRQALASDIWAAIPLDIRDVATHDSKGISDMVAGYIDEYLMFATCVINNTDYKKKVYHKDEQGFVIANRLMYYDFIPSTELISIMITKGIKTSEQAFKFLYDLWNNTFSAEDTWGYSFNTASSIMAEYYCKRN